MRVPNALGFKKALGLDRVSVLDDFGCLVILGVFFLRYLQERIKMYVNVHKMYINVHKSSLNLNMYIFLQVLYSKQ